MAWATFNYIWRPFTHTPVSDCYSLDQRRISPAAWFVSIQGRIVVVRPLGRPVPPTLGGYTGVSTIGRQRGLQRVLGVHAPVCVGVRIRARARDSTCMGDCREALCVPCIMCLDTACVSKPTNWWENPIVSIWQMSSFRLRGPIGGIVGKSADKVYYDKPLSRPSTYRGILRRGILAGAWRKINVTCHTLGRRRNRMLSTTGRGTRV